jgi:hypothetical protein
MAGGRQGPGPDARTVADRLRDQIEALAREVIPDGRREGGEWRGRGPDGGTWSVVLRGHKAGVWSNWGDDRMRGDALELVRWGLCGGDRREAYRRAIAWLGLDHAAAGDRPAPPPRPRPEPAAEVERMRRLALARYLGARPDIRGTPAEAYLAGRGIELHQLAAVPGALRFGEVWHSQHGAALPAMVAAIISPVTGQHIATHTTYLEQLGGRWGKLRRGAAKMVLGSFRGGVIPLQRGASRRSLRQAPEGDCCLLSEGIEDGLTMALAHPERRALAAVSVAHLPAIELPPAIGDILLVWQRDGLNAAVQRSRETTMQQWLAQGRTVSVWMPPEGFADANDYWRAIGSPSQQREGAA